MAVSYLAPFPVYILSGFIERSCFHVNLIVLVTCVNLSHGNCMQIWHCVCKNVIRELRKGTVLVIMVVAWVVRAAGDNE